MIAILFTLTSMLAAGLLFLVQPMVARMVLPAFGGSPHVWTTAMLFFQSALLIGYGYTHWTTNYLPRRAQIGLHLLLMLVPLFFLPIVLTVSPSGVGGVWPTLELLAALTLSVAVPFVMIATSGPLIQRWFSWTNHSQANDPYFLYAAGNVGSIGGLLLYPFVYEPHLSIGQQSWFWLHGYVIVVVLLTGCGTLAWRYSLQRATGPVESVRSTLSTAADFEVIRWQRIGHWIFLAFVPSSLMLGVTAHLTTDIASIPMLWVLPLVVYLLTFTISFSRWGPWAYRWAAWLLPPVAVLAVVLRPTTLGITFAVAVQVALILLGGLVAHGKLSLDRPSASRLTLFYLMLSIGGALGGIFNGLIAPAIFPHVFEFGLIVAITLALVIHWPEMVNRSAKWHVVVRLSAAMLLFAIPLICLSLVHYGYLPTDRWAAGAVLAVFTLPLLTVWARGSMLGVGVLLAGIFPAAYQVSQAVSIERTFFGVHRVTQDNTALKLIHGTTIHGKQDLQSFESRQEPLTYYHRRQPFGQIMELLPMDSHQRIGVVGLGAGSIAAYATPQTRMVFHEIDPAVIAIAESKFYYLRDARERGADIPHPVVGDGRFTLQARGETYDLLVLDAFSSDAIPVHLLTIEALQIYLDVLAPDGIIAFHISNNYLDLQPVLRAAIEALDLAGRHRFGIQETDQANASHWVAVSRSQSRLEALQERGWRELPARTILWTDQRSSLWSVRIGK